MPVIPLDRLPLPNLRTYVTVSVLLLTSSVFYAAEVTSDPEWKNNLTTYATDTKTVEVEKNESTVFVMPNGIVEEIIPKRFKPKEVMAFMIRDPLCIWSLINGAYCCLILLGKIIQGAVFGELRVSEQQHVRDKFWNFLFYKFIFVFGVMNVQHLDDVLLWCSWFSLLGALQLLSQLCKDRFEYLSFSPTTPRWSHIRLMSLLAAILIFSWGLLALSAAVGIYLGLNTFAFMAAECLLLSIRTLHVMLRYGLHLYDISRHHVETRPHQTPVSTFEDASNLSAEDDDDGSIKQIPEAVAIASSTTLSRLHDKGSKFKWWHFSAVFSHIWAHIEDGCVVRWLGRFRNISSGNQQNVGQRKGGLFSWLRRSPRLTGDGGDNGPSTSSGDGGRESWFPWVSWYHVELWFELGGLILDAAHHLHMLLWANVFLSMASLVICMQLRYLAHEVRRRLQRHRNYLCVLKHMQDNYPMATEEDLSANSDNCAICWEKMDAARKLPCSHLFHDSCLQSWLEQDASCPTCRLVLRIESGRPRGSAMGREMGVVAVEEELTGGGLGIVGGGGRMGDGHMRRRQPNHFFHFDGSRYVSWLPSFSVEVTHTQLLQFDDHPRQASTSQLDSMAREIQQLFPRMPLHVLVDDLHDTHSIELTVENVLEGRLLPPPATLYHVAPASNLPNAIPSSTIPSHQSSSALSTPTHQALQNPHGPEENGGLMGGGASLNGSSRFSKSSSEREKILQQRKERLVATARRRYLEKHASSSGLGPPTQDDA
ncbi:E3 ubiquitin-protein ligase AMFR-like [Ischnura elegans]|uniref:E3 ubiquitin-protein ligase AMFR-like n=1 Tax=Ischnura elegans TaxID=197161 RepID=UPI001ED8BFB0|nr:E3 ubiquitin-protein ligase AMFR-like [Ischnura elegans]